MGKCADPLVSVTSALRCTLVQTDLSWEAPEANLHMLGEKLQSIDQTDLLLLPEMFPTGFTMNKTDLAEPMDGTSVRWMLEMANSKDAVVAGSLIIQEGDQTYNRLILAYPDGQLAWYDKRHLFSPGKENLHYRKGTERKIMVIKGWKVLPLICYDLRFPVWSANQDQDGIPYAYDLVFYLANWPITRMNAWDSLLQARAIENQAYCIGVNRIGKDANQLNYSGHSAAYDYLGTRIVDAREQEGIHTVTLDRSGLQSFRSKLPFVQDADTFKIIN